MSARLFGLRLPRRWSFSFLFDFDLGHAWIGTDWKRTQHVGFIMDVLVVKICPVPFATFVLHFERRAI